MNAIFGFTGNVCREGAFWVFAVGVSLCFVGEAGARLLTAADGRSIEAEVKGFDGDKVIIERKDNGQVYNLPLSAFAAADQEALRKEALAQGVKKPKALAPEAISLDQLSRAIVATRKQVKDVTLLSGGIARDALVMTEEDWAYGITLRNNTRTPIEGLRVEYYLFTKINRPGTKKEESTLKRTKGLAVFETAEPGARVAVRTKSVVALKTELKDGIRYAKTGADDSRDTLHGIWLRVYHGEDMLLETASPAGLAAKDKWGE